jgi:pimeloyl-ACP methyl ester carboxylesterase
VDIHRELDAVSQHVPVRVIIGHADRIISWRDVLNVSPRISVHHFPTAGHMPHWDQPLDVADILVFGARPLNRA